MFNSLKKTTLAMLTLAVLVSSGILAIPQIAEAKGCPAVKPGEYFKNEGLNPFVHYIDPITLNIKYYNTYKVAKNNNLNVIILSHKCFDKIYKLEDLNFSVSVHDPITSQPLHGSYVVMYIYNLVPTDDPLYSDTKTAYKVVDYVIKRVDESANPSGCVLTSKYSTTFTVPVDRIVNFFGFKNYNDALKDAQAKMGTLSNFGYPYKNFGYPKGSLLQTDYRNPDTWFVYNGSPSGASGLSVLAK